ncbi:hypothetical protein PR048_016653 [Dryococelus australis]|uniref:Uncharacterized protein n=1 Tax=Dryococelus australis TaxID=614101 RepID=A0ABQ9H7A7_9NEOP|nr:hypothetical protein PR048_016653 [Dryococelus australis]
MQIPSVQRPGSTFAALQSSCSGRQRSRIGAGIRAKGAGLNGDVFTHVWLRRTHTAELLRLPYDGCTGGVLHILLVAHTRRLAGDQTLLLSTPYYSCTYCTFVGFSSRGRTPARSRRDQSFQGYPGSDKTRQRARPSGGGEGKDGSPPQSLASHNGGFGACVGACRQPGLRYKGSRGVVGCDDVRGRGSALSRRAGVRCPSSCEQIARLFYPSSAPLAGDVGKLDEDVDRKSRSSINGGAVASALSSHLGDPGSSPGGFASGFSHVGIVLDDAACRRVFSGFFSFPRPCIPVPLHPRVSFHVTFRDNMHLLVPAGKPVRNPGLKDGLFIRVVGVASSCGRQAAVSIVPLLCCALYPRLLFLVLIQGRLPLSPLWLRTRVVRRLCQPRRHFSQDSPGSSARVVSYRKIWAALNSWRRNKGVGNREIPEKTRRPTASSSTIPTCESPVTRSGIEPSLPWWETSVLIAQPPRPPKLKSSASWILNCVFIGCCPAPGSYGIRKVLPCKSAIGSEACRAGLINCDPIAKCYVLHLAPDASSHYAWSDSGGEVTHLGPPSQTRACCLVASPAPLLSPFSQAAGELLTAAIRDWRHSPSSACWRSRQFDGYSATRGEHAGNPRCSSWRNKGEAQIRARLPCFSAAPASGKEWLEKRQPCSAAVESALRPCPNSDHSSPIRKLRCSPFLSSRARRHNPAWMWYLLVDKRIPSCRDMSLDGAQRRLYSACMQPVARCDDPPCWWSVVSLLHGSCGIEQCA